VSDWLLYYCVFVVALTYSALFRRAVCAALLEFDRRESCAPSFDWLALSRQEQQRTRLLQAARALVARLGALELGFLGLTQRYKHVLRVRCISCRV
jgi:hypothetical protein